MGNACSGSGARDGTATSKLASPLLSSDELAVAIPSQRETISSYSPVEVINVANPVLFDQTERNSDEKATVAMDVEYDVTRNVSSDRKPAETALDRPLRQEPVPTPLKRHDTFPNSDTYVGEYIMESAQPHGKIQVPLKHGHGTYTYADGSSFVGTYSRGQMVHGVFTHVQQSHIKDGCITGTSIIPSNHSESTAVDTSTDPPVSAPILAHMSNDIPQDFNRASVVILAMSIYEGDFESGKYHGAGKIIYVGNGADSVSSPSINDDARAKFVGTSVSEDPSASVTEFKSINTHMRRLEVAYDGQWRNGRRQGFGRALLFDGRTIEGYWYADRLLACVDHKHHFISLLEDKIDRTISSGSRRNSYRRFVSPRDADAAKTPGRTYLVEELAREVCPDGSVYVGAFSSGLKRHTVRHSSLPQIDLELRFEAKGCASITFSNGDILSAHFRNGVLYGRGMMQYKSSGNIYDGHFSCRERRTSDCSPASDSEDATLFGRMRLNAGDLAGTVAFDGGNAVAKVNLSEAPYFSTSFECHGEGKYCFQESGAVYVGQFAYGKKEGTGVYIDRFGSSYRGEYANDQFHGQGTYRWSSGSEFSGQWRSGKKCGPFGRLISAIGDVYECAWFQDQKHGPGKVIYKNGDAYFGLFVNDLKHGQAEILFATGVYEVCKYKEGEVKRIILRSKPGQDGHLDMRTLEENFRITMQEHSLSFARKEHEYLLHQKTTYHAKSDPDDAERRAPTDENAKMMSPHSQSHGTSPPLPGSVVEIIPSKLTGLKSVVSSVGKLIGITKPRNKQLQASPSPTKTTISASSD